MMIVEGSEDSTKPLSEHGPIASWLKELDERDDELRSLSIEKIAIALESMKFDDWFQDWLRRCILRLLPECLNVSSKDAAAYLTSASLVVTIILLFVGSVYSK